MILNIFVVLCNKRITRRALQDATAAACLTLTSEKGGDGVGVKRMTKSHGLGECPCSYPLQWRRGNRVGRAGAVQVGRVCAGDRARL
jgi:hypothetical protein